MIEMAKTFAMLVGCVLVLVGVLNFFVEPIMLSKTHGVVHVVAGLLGIWAAKQRAVGYALWVGIIGGLLGLLGLLTDDLLGFVDLPTWITVVHFVLAIWGFWTYWAAMKKPAAAGGGPTPMAGV